MIVGVDVVNAGRSSIVGMTATYTQNLTQHLGRIEYQDMFKDQVRKGQIKKEQQDEMIVMDRSKYLQQFIIDAIHEYRNHNNGNAPGYIVVYRDGVGGPTFAEAIMNKEILEVQQAI